MATISPPISPLLCRNIGGASAFDRLEADKAKYVKSPQVIHRRQNPALNATLSPTISRRPQLACYKNGQQEDHCLNGRDGSNTQQQTLPFYCISKQQTNHSHSIRYTSTMHFNSPSPYGCPGPKTECLPCKSLSPAQQQRPLQPHGMSELQTDHTPRPSYASTSPQYQLRTNQSNNGVQAPNSPMGVPRCGRKVRRPDSLIIYRQKRDRTLDEKENNDEREGFLERILNSTPLLKRRTSSTQDPPKMCLHSVSVSSVEQSLIESSVCNIPLTDNFRSQDTGSGELDSFPPSHAHTFFESCGLEGSLLNLIDKNCYHFEGETTPLGSLESVDRLSSGLKLPEEEKEEKTAVSVVERNARVIKWIYSCHNAQSTKKHTENQTPRESVV
ncbi:protein FAM110D [Bombina bombina]|uniref:protein FAM110D n=1 Tax=Bombina bombina TaxID=8345 RepID=UPI00235ADB22|nr:protein FAM110D [Bombina bombina]